MCRNRKTNRSEASNEPRVMTRDGLLNSTRLDPIRMHTLTHSLAIALTLIQISTTIHNFKKMQNNMFNFCSNFVCTFLFPSSSLSLFLLLSLSLRLASPPPLLCPALLSHPGYLLLLLNLYHFISNFQSDFSSPICTFSSSLSASLPP